MTIEIRNGRYISQIFFAAGEGFDVMGSLYRDGSEPFVLLYRFRYYDGPDQDKGPFADGDQKSWTRVVFEGDEGPAPEAAAIEVCRGMFALLASGPPLGEPMEVTILDLRTDDTEAIRAALLAQPWAHAMPVKKPGAEA